MNRDAPDAREELKERLSTLLGDAYTLDRELGGGGMSRVFVADETSLGRRVVIKVLAPELAEGVNAERFKREVRLAARLQHPHIVPLLTAGVLTDGEQPAVLYYSMPFVDGESLLDRLAREGALPVTDAVRLLRDVASALSYAHRQSVVHRDVKPGNVLLADGGALVTDFGIARAIRAARQSGDDHQPGSETITQLGVSVGTPQYMAPEQASGDVVDHRADLYALGVVAYEILAGRPPFEGRTAQQLLAAHATELPEPLERRRPTVPSGLASLVMQLLEKNPADRPQSAEAVLQALDRAESPRYERIAVAPARTAAPRRTVSAVPWVLLAVAVAVIIGLTVTRAGSDDAPLRPVAAALTVPPGVEPSQTHGANATVNFALSPDGSQLAFAASDREGRLALWVRRLASLTPDRLAGTDGASGPFWSPDGKSLGFFAAGRLKTLDLTGGAVRTLCPVSWSGGGTWVGANRVVYSPNFLGPLYSVDPGGGTCSRLTQLRPGDYGHRTPTALPDGRHVLFSSSRGDFALVADVTTGAIVEARSGARDARFAAPHWLLFLEVDNGPLFAQRLDLSSFRAVGEPRKLLDRVYTVAGFANYSVAPRSLVAQEPRVAAEAPKILWLDRRSVVVDSAIAPEGVRRVAVSHDGRRLAMYGEALWLYDRDRRVSTRTRATVTARQAINDAAWSPGDSSIAYGLARDGPITLRLYHVATDRSDSLFSVGRQVIGQPAWSADGQRIAFTLSAGEDAHLHEIWIYSLVTRRATRAWETPGNLSAPRWSPDGRSIAYVSDESGSPEVYLRPASGSGVATRVSTAGGQFPRWRADGRELYYQRADGAMMVVGVSLAAVPQLTAPRVALAPGGFARTDRGVEVTSDGGQFVSFSPVTAPIFTLLLDWTARLANP